MTTTGPVFEKPQQQRSRSGGRWAIGCLLALGLFFVVIAVAMVVFNGGTSGYFEFGPRIGLVRIEGEMWSPEEAVRELNELHDDGRVGAIVVRLNTPGGTVGTTQEIHDAILNVRSAGLPVVASFGDVSASGGYYVAAACDSIVTNPGTLTGSIGVIFSFPETGELYRKIGLGWQVVKSGDYKDIGTQTRPMTDEERRLLEGIVNDTHDQFVAAVVDGRGLPEAAVREIADGRIMTGRQALELGLVDRLGTFEDARVLAARLAGAADDTPFLSKHRERFSFLEFVTSRLPLPVEELSRLGESPRLEYRWR